MSAAVVASAAPPRRRVPGRALVAGGLVALIVLATVLAPLLAPAGPDDQDLLHTLQGPFTDGHLLGTDQIGRDMLSRILYGGRLPLLIGSVAAIASVTIGAALGLTSGFLGGRVDGVLGRVVDIQLSVPALLLALVVLAFAGSSTFNLIVVLVLALWPGPFRVARAHALALRGRPFVEAAALGGAGRASIVGRHVLPAFLPVAAVLTTLALSSALLVEASLGFLGLGVPPPTPDWGAMVSAGESQLGGAWWLAAAPGVCLLLLLLGVQVFGDWLAERLSIGGLMEHRKGRGRRAAADA